MKVLQINSVCGSGSTGKITIEIYKELLKNGHECCIAYGRGEGSKAVTTHKICNKLDFLFHVLFSRFTDRQGFYSYFATKKFVEWIKIYNPDVIHLHNLHGYYLNIRLLFMALKELGKPVVWTLHDCWAFTGHCSYFTAKNCEQWRIGCEKCKHKFEYPSSYFRSNSKKNYLDKSEIFTSIENMVIVTPSNWLKKIVQESFLGKYEIVTMYNNIDTSVFRFKESNFREKYNLQDYKIILGVANIWSERKGLDDFNALVKILDDEFVIFLVGVTRKQRKKLDQRIISIERTNNINELVEIYSAADVYVNTSVEETMGLTTVEALACQTQALVYNCSASPEILNYDKEYIVDFNSQRIAQLKLKIVKILNENKKVFFDENKFTESTVKVLINNIYYKLTKIM